MASSQGGGGSLFESVSQLDSSNVPNLLALGDALGELGGKKVRKTLNTAVLYQDQMTEGDRTVTFQVARSSTRGTWRDG